MKSCLSLTQTIITDLSAIKNVSDAVSIIHTSALKLQLLQKKQVFYLSDGHIIIQAIMSLSNTATSKQQYPKPFNRIRTNFYNFQVKQANLFLFNQEDDQSSQYPSPYQPKFHLQERISNFDSSIARSQIANITQVLLIRQWSIKVVNIANTGYYGVVLEIIQYERLREKFINTPTLHSVLYEKEISDILEKLRINNMRIQIGLPKRQKPISLCYYRKNIKVNSINKNLQSNFVMADRNSKFTKVDLSNKKYYIPIGDMSGVLRFIRPLNDVQSGRKTMINFSKFRQLPETREKSTYDMQQSEKQDNQSEQQECQEIQNQNQEQSQKDGQEEENQSSSQDDEILKMIYSKQLQKMTIL